VCGCEGWNNAGVHQKNINPTDEAIQLFLHTCQAMRMPNSELVESLDGGQGTIYTSTSRIKLAGLRIFNFAEPIDDLYMISIGHHGRQRLIDSE
jgi:hypothetical protein